VAILDANFCSDETCCLTEDGGDAGGMDGFVTVVLVVVGQWQGVVYLPVSCMDNPAGGGFNGAAVGCAAATMIQVFSSHTIFLCCLDG
jgi:hypothetical protein